MAEVEQVQQKTVKLSKKDFVSDADVRWCPGCGDYSILANMQRVLPGLGVLRENTVFVSGIGCSSRFPYYMNTFGFHTIHGRVAAVASGLKVMRPDLDVWLVTGDGDSLSIGGNHLIHLLRRNIGLKVLLFNNRIYGLTKGQYSPTSEVGKRSPSTPQGSIDAPFNPLALALGCGATFVARCTDTDAKSMKDILQAAHKHRGTAFIEIYQNCNVFNDNAFVELTAKDQRDDTRLMLEDGAPLRWGRDKDRILVMRDGQLRAERLTDGGYALEDAWVHRAGDSGGTLAWQLATMEGDDMPVPMGILRCVERAVFEDQVHQQLDDALEREGKTDLDTMLRGTDSWEVHA